MKKVITLLVLLLALTTVTNAKVVYTDLNPDSTMTMQVNPGFGQGIRIDFDKDGTVDCMFRWDDWGQQGWFMHMIPGPMPGSQFNDLLLSQMGDVEPLNLNDAIGSTGNWGNGLPEPFIGFDFRPNFANKGDKYAGVRFKSGNNTYYGWVLINFDTTNSKVITVKSFAYEDVANTSIKAGDTGGGGNPGILVTSISVQGQGGATTITTAGGTLQMNETVAPANATNKNVTWSVTPGTGSATISTSGLLTAVSNGTVTVVATANDGSGITGNTVITLSNQNPPNVLVTGIVILGQGGAFTITVQGGTIQMLENVSPTNATDKTVTWSVVPGTGAATISSSGLLTAVSDGVVTVIATANDGSGITSNNYDVTISNQTLPTLVTGITVQGQGGATTITTPGGTLQMEETVAPANATNQNVTWSVQAGTGTATIDATGLLTASTDGTVTVTATANDGSGVTGTAEITLSNQSSTTGILETNDYGLSVYPNPATESLTIQTSSSFKLESIALTDLSGKIVLVQNGLIQDQDIQLDLSSLKEGTYLLQLKNEEAQVVIKRIMVN